MEPNAVSEIVHNLRQLEAMGERPKDNAELKERIYAYFEYCEATGTRPGVESLCTSLHIDRSTFHSWTIGKRGDAERQEIARWAKQVMAAFWEQASMKGLINPATSCFVAKNWFGYQDQSTVTHEVIESRPALTASELPKLSATRELAQGETVEFIEVEEEEKKEKPEG